MKTDTRNTRIRSTTQRLIELVACSAAMVCLVMVAAPGTGFAGRLEGPCKVEGDRCVSSMEHRLTEDEMARFLARRNGPRFPAQSVAIDLKNRATRIIERGPMSGNGPQGEQAIEALTTETAGDLDLISTPWLSAFYKAHVKLVITFPFQQGSGDSYSCSGVIIGSHTVLTAGHCVFIHPESGDTFQPQFADSIKVYPAMSGASPFGGYITPYGAPANAAEVSTSTWWADYQDYDGDWALIRLNENIGDLTGWPAITWGGTHSGYLNYAGYPGAEGYSGKNLYRGSGVIEDMDSYLICHNGHTIKGMSGGPAWFYNSDTEERKVTAVNSFGYIGTDTFCTARYNDQVEDVRADFESVNGLSKNDVWTCGLSTYGTKDGCDCDCTIRDPDCADTPDDLYNCEQVNAYCDTSGECACAADSCYDLGIECGSAPDGCGGTVQCGGCGDFPNAYCGSSGQCECVPETCSSLNIGCGPVADGCGGTIECGGCGSLANAYCGSDGQCDCLADTCSSLGMDCGIAVDGCGGQIDCGTCEVDICVPDTCASQGITCGLTADNCGGQIDCGPCDPGTCTPSTCSSLGMTCGITSNGCGGTLDCGICDGEYEESSGGCTAAVQGKTAAAPLLLAALAIMLVLRKRSFGPQRTR